MDADADADLLAGRAPPSARTPLSRERIVEAAVAYIEDEGLAGLTMRRLGMRLGVEAMALYRYVPGKDDLLDAVVEHLMDELDDDDEVHDEPEDGWQDFLQRLAHGVRRVALAHPQAFPLVVSRPPEAPWLRPPLRSLRWVEKLILALQAEGFDDEGAVAAYRGFSHVLLGHLLLEVTIHGAEVGPLDALTDTGEVGDAGDAGDTDQLDAGLADYPALQRLRHQLCQNHAVVEFEVALEQLLDRLALLRSEQDQHGH